MFVGALGPRVVLSGRLQGHLSYQWDPPHLWLFWNALGGRWHSSDQQALMAMVEGQRKVALETLWRQKTASLCREAVTDSQESGLQSSGSRYIRR